MEVARWSRGAGVRKPPGEETAEDVDEVVRQALRGFSYCRSFAEVGWELFRQAIAGATKRVGRLQGSRIVELLRGGDGMRRRLS